MAVSSRRISLIGLDLNVSPAAIVQALVMAVIINPDVVAA